MALERKNRAQDSTTTTGTGTIDLAGTSPDNGYLPFVSVFTSGATVRYLIISDDSSEWEVGQGVFTDATPDTLTRASVYSSSNSGSAVDFSAGTKKVYCVLVAEDLDDFLQKSGGTITGDIQLGETDIKLDETLSGDETWSGVVISGTAGAQLVVGEVCYLASSGKWLKVDGILDGTDTGFNKELGMCVLAASGDTEPTEILKYGKIRSAKFPALTIGSPAYLSDTAGEIVVAQPSTTNFAVRVVGYAITAEDLLFNPSNDYIVHI